MENKPDESRPQKPEPATGEPPLASPPPVAPAATPVSVSPAAETPPAEPAVSAAPVSVSAAEAPVETGDPAYHDARHDSYHDEHSHEHDYHHESGGAALPPGGGGPAEEIDPLYAPDSEGGPVKSFLEHLEDFRWMLIKCASALLVAMTVCLLGVNYVVAILEWPLKRAALFDMDKRPFVSVMFGPKEVINFRADTNHIPGFILGTNRYVELELVPLDLGTNKILAIQVRTNSSMIPPAKAKPLIYKSPADPFINSLHLAFFGGMLFAAPFLFYYIAQFVLPALRDREKKYFLKALAPAVFLFVCGVSLCYFLILPLALRAAEVYSLWMGVEMPFWQAQDYFGFVTKFMLGMGLGFEMPVILLALVKIGLLDYQKLAGFRRYMVLINLILGALLTTPEVLTQVAMFVPLQSLYEITIWIAWYWEQSDRTKARRRATLVFVAILLLGLALGLGIKFGWPQLKGLLP